MKKRFAVRSGLVCCALLGLFILTRELPAAKLEVGKPVEVSMKSGWTVSGKLLKIATDSVTLDVSAGAAAFAGRLTLASDSVISIRPIEKVTIYEPTTPAPRPSVPKMRTPTPSPTPPAAEASPESERAELLKKFPPEDGWGKEKLENIKWRRVILGLFPAPEEEEFIEVFEDWEKAWEAEQKAKEGSDEKAGPQGEGKGTEDAEKGSRQE